MRLLITGADGFVGKHVVHGALAQGHEVVAVTRSKREPSDKRIQNIQCNLLYKSSWERLSDALTSVDAIVHLAAIMPSNDFSLDEYNLGNCDFTAYFLDQISGRDCPVVYFSTIGVFGELNQENIDEGTSLNINSNLHPYFQSKLNTEKMIKESRAPVYVFRLSSPYGPLMNQQSVLPLFVNKALNDEGLHWHGDGARTQDFIYVDDVVKACLKAIRSSIGSGLFYLTSGQATSMKNLATAIANKTGVKVSPSGQDDPQEHLVWSVNNAKLKQFLDEDEMISIDEGITRYISSLDNISLHEQLVWWKE